MLKDDYYIIEFIFKINKLAKILQVPSEALLEFLLHEKKNFIGLENF